MNFLSAVNRVLRSNNIIRGDDDDIVTFNDVQHNATLNLAIIAIQDELNDLVSDRLVDYEFATGTITTSVSASTYSLAPDFVQFFGIPKFTTGSRFIVEYPGGLKALEIDVINYDQQTGSPNWWYFKHAVTKQVAFWPTPNVSEVLSYNYEKDVSVDDSTDSLPFHNEMEAQAFCAAAGRRFKFLFEDAQNVDAVLSGDASYQSAKSRIIRLMKGRNPYSTYGYTYR
jgi:hypothetical protein